MRLQVSRVNSCSWLDSCCKFIGTVSGMKIRGVLSSVCIERCRVGNILDPLWNHGRLLRRIAVQRSRGLACVEDWLRFLGSVSSVAVSMYYHC
jgi:hypothetical protein